MKNHVAAAAVAGLLLFSAPSAHADTAVVEGAFAPPGWIESQFTLCQQQPCTNIVYPNIFPSPATIDVGVTQLEAWLNTPTAQAAPTALAAPTEQTVIGHSMGGQVIYAYLRAHPDAPGVFISLGNPERKYGGQQHGADQGLPTNLTATVIDVVRQYDGWADAPADTSNPLVVLNAIMGGFIVHPFYNVNIDDPNNVRWQEGSVTYVVVPTPTLPLLMPLEWIGLNDLAAQLDNKLRPQIEAAYTRPVPVPDPTPPAVDPTIPVQTATVATTSEAATWSSSDSSTATPVSTTSPTLSSVKPAAADTLATSPSPASPPESKNPVSDPPLSHRTANGSASTNKTPATRTAATRTKTSANSSTGSTPNGKAPGPRKTRSSTSSGSNNAQANPVREPHTATGEKPTSKKSAATSPKPKDSTPDSPGRQRKADK